MSQNAFLKIGRIFRKIISPEKEKDLFLNQATGVIHIGANSGQERKLYARHDLDVLWIEPNPKVFKELQKNIDNLKKDELKLAKLEKDLITKKNILSKEEFDKKFSEINLNISSFRKEKKKIIQDFENKKKKEISSFFKRINPILIEYMKKNSLDLILDKKSLIIAKNELDITIKIKEIIDNQIK